MTTNRNLILLTGATGFIGFRVLVEALKAGYAVRCAIRSSQAIKVILSTPSIRALKPSEHQLYWAFVPDMAVPGAFDAAVKGVKYIIHCASPASNTNVRGSAPTNSDEWQVQTAINSMCWLLQSAYKLNPSTVRRIVFTSSLTAIIPHAYFKGQGGLTGPAFNAESRLPMPSAPFASGSGPHAASKIAALNASESWVRHFRPPFDLVSILPACVWGRHELAGTADELTKGSSGVMIDLLRGQRNDTPICGSFIGIEDVAKAHVLALDRQVSGNQSFILSSDMAWEDTKVIAQRAFPSVFDKGIFSVDGTQKSVGVAIDASKTERVLGLKFQSFEHVVTDVVSQWLELSQARLVSVCAIIALARGSWSEENVSIQLASSFPVVAGHKAKAHGFVT
ncbi:hypothetical protein D7B24_005023 [Verticillium nonalfalfae]|uniref:NAD-dependent epimerase/dehydratase domain-containing protein n=1 Tax=Verticillium nonalfalfae TaxID=1051616 RepID=A0A3M9YL29_9PEZI|nr:uncharacterized protein D7B24_005023 [Verticillium nonalfalfae]RNJ60935.1 hypothetical protein D7B24_005023 [Verticillium nonalfalfae]